MYSPLNASSFFTSKYAGEECTSSRRHNRASSSNGMISWSPGGAHPSSIRKFCIVSGRYPSSRYSSSATGSRRFDSFCRFSFTSSGTCANTGSSPPSRALQSMMALGVLGRCSSARITWLIRMSMSSTTFASRNIALPLPRTRTKSSMRAFSNSGSPRMRSTTVVVPSPRSAEAQRPTLARRRGPDRGRTRRSQAALRPSSGRPRLHACSRSSTRCRRRRGAWPPRRTDACAGSGSTDPRPSPRRSSGARSGCRRSTRRGCARCRCPRCAARTRRRADARRSSCTGRSWLRRRGSTPSEMARTARAGRSGSHAEATGTRRDPLGRHPGFVGMVSGRSFVAEFAHGSKEEPLERRVSV